MVVGSGAASVTVGSTAGVALTTSRTKVEYHVETRNRLPNLDEPSIHETEMQRTSSSVFSFLGDLTLGDFSLKGARSLARNDGLLGLAASTGFSSVVAWIERENIQYV